MKTILYCKPFLGLFSPKAQHRYYDEHVLLNSMQLFFGVLLLLIGVLFYYFERNTPILAFEYFGIVLPSYNKTQNSFGSLGHNLPSLLHALSFPLIMGAFVKASRFRYLMVCTFWLIVDLIFEISQAINEEMIPSMPGLIKNLFSLEQIKNFVTKGVYDNKDIIAIVIGIAFSYCILLLTESNKS